MQVSLMLRRVLGTLACTALVAGTLGAADKDEAKPNSALSFKMKTLEGKEADLAQYKGKVVMIVNVASECGLTPQYEQLQALHQQHSDEGLVILGFPCNQFGSQEPGSDAEIKEFCTANYDVKFPMFSKVAVNGDQAAPLYKYLKAQQTEPKGPGEISWNFEKFVIDREGKVVARFEPQTKPDAPEVMKVIEAELAKK